ncbi:MAG: acetylglutamate kinase [Actinomycetota bacterium]|nr:acetylglutamate kinase [Actinomycetota bacterium]
MIVVKIGGGALAGGALEDIPPLLSSGTPVVLVHGGGPSLTRMLDALDIPTRFHEGLRVTDERTLEVAEMVFAGQVNKSLVRELVSLGVPAVGISGTDGPTLLVEGIEELGRVGEIVRVDTKLLETIASGGFVPTVAPLGVGPVGDGSGDSVGAYNVNADMAAAAISSALGASHLFLMTDVDGFLEGGEVIAGIPVGETESYIESGAAEGGMAPKLRAASKAAKSGVEARIINGNTKGALAKAVAGGKVGTVISDGSEGVA